MRRLITFILMVIFLSFGHPAFSQTETYTLEKAIETAMENNRETKIARMEVTKAKAAVDEAIGNALPSLDLTGNYTRFLEKQKMAFPDFESMLNNATYGVLFQENIIPYDPNKLQPMETTLQSFVQTNSYEVTAQVNQILFNSAVFRGIGASEIYLRTSKEQLNSKLSNVVLSVKKAFYGVILSKDVLEITRESYENAKENYENVKALYEEGLVSEFDALQAEVEVENIKPTIQMMENNLQQAKDGLKMSMGLDPTVSIEVEGKIEYNKESIPDTDRFIQKALKKNYDLKSLKLKKEVDKAFVDLDRSGYWPNLNAFANYSFAGSSDDFDFQNYRSSIVGVSFSINLFKGFQTQNKVQQSKIEVEKTNEQIMQLKDGISSQVRIKILELQRVKSNIEAQERNVNIAERAYELATVRYKEGTGSQLEVQNADIALRRAKNNRLRAIYDYIIAKAELKNLIVDKDDKY